LTPPLRPPPPQSLRERARLTLKYLRYLPRTFALVKESSRAFAAGMVALLIGQAALPAAMAWVGKLIVDAVVEAARSGQAAERWHVLRLVGLEERPSLGLRPVLDGHILVDHRRGSRLGHRDVLRFRRRLRRGRRAGAAKKQECSVFHDSRFNVF